MANPTQRKAPRQAPEAAQATEAMQTTAAPDRKAFAALALLAGLLWGLNLIKLGLSSSFAMATEPMGAAAQQGMLVSFTLTFLALALWGQRDSRLLASPRWAVVFGTCLVVGSVPLFAPLDALPSAEVLSFLFAVLHASGNVYFLCALASSIAEFPRHRKVRCLLYAVAFACLILAIGAALPAWVLRLSFPLAALAFVGGFLLTARTLRPNVSDGRAALQTSKRQLVQYATYGISLGALPSMAGIGGGDLGLSWFFVIAIIACVVVLMRQIYPRTSQAPLVVEGIAVGLTLLCLLPLGLPLQSLFYTMLIAAWLLFWVFLCCAVPFAAAGRGALAFYLFLACFAVGRLAVGSLMQVLSTVSPLVAQGLLLALFCLALAIPLSEILESLKFAGRTIGDEESAPSASPASGNETAGSAASQSGNGTYGIVSGSPKDEAEAAFPYERLRAICERLGDEHQLTRREKEILCLLAQGRGRQYISDALVISEGTAKTHIKHVYAKLGVHSKDELLNLIHERR